MVGMGLVGFLDDFIKISEQRSLGLNAKAKLILQAAVGIIFAVMALNFPDADGLTPASTKISLVRDIPWLDLAFGGTVLGAILFVLWSNLIVTAATNGVNLTDGLDGLAAGACDHGLRRLHAHGHLAEQPGLRLARGRRAAAATPSATPWTWPCLRPS